MALVSMEAFALVSCDSLYLPVMLSSLGASDLPCDLTSIMDLRKVANFSVCSAFYLLLGWSGDFQAPYVPDQKPEVPSVCFEK